LDLIGVDDSLDISVGEAWSLEAEVGESLRLGSWGTEHGVEGQEGRSGPDTESTEVGTWGELLDVKTVDVANIDTWDVSQGFGNWDVGVIEDEEWTSVHLISSVSGLTSTGSDGSRFAASVNIFHSTESGEEVNDNGGLRDIIEAVLKDQWHAWDVVDSVTSGLDQWDASGGSQSRAKSISSLVKINLSVPSSPGFEWSEHSTFTGHIGESGLASSLGTGTSDSWNSGHSSTWTPGDSSMSHTGKWVDTSSLSGVLGKVRVDEVHDITSDW
jgi:hypothetical protein